MRGLAWQWIGRGSGAAMLCALTLACGARSLLEADETEATSGTGGQGGGGSGGVGGSGGAAASGGTIGPRCGNGVREGTEECDDGNQRGGDGCGPTCRFEECGNGHIDPGEECDDHDLVSGDGCDERCQMEPPGAVCGDGALENGEECDDGNQVSGDGCSPTCRIELEIETCPDGILQPWEQCEDGNAANGDGCDQFCRAEVTPACGDFVINPGERCDDANRLSGDGCTAWCWFEQWDACGDGILAAPEQCDDGNDASGDGCSMNCRLEPATGFCGDGWVHGGEACDDGNRTGGDGCSALCQPDTIAFPRCGDGGVGAGEECDDGNLRSHDGCSSGCTLEVPTWTELDVAEVVPELPTPLMVYDGHRDWMLLLAAHQSTWAFDGSSWRDLARTPVQDWAAGAYDRARQRLVLFGGDRGGLTASDVTYELLDVDWWGVGTDPTPSPRFSSALTYDIERARVLMFGGTENPSTGHLNDTWEYDGATWVERHTADRPGRRAGHGLVFHEQSQRAVLFGGWVSTDAGTEYHGDTWLYDGMNWSQIHLPVSPDSRAAMGLAYDSWRGVVVLFGGYRESNRRFGDTWEFDGTSWVETTPAASPSARWTRAMAYDSLRRRVVLFGGDAADGEVRDTWVYRLESAWPDEICHNGLDDDSDGAVDCFDPDCEDQLCDGGRCLRDVCR